MNKVTVFPKYFTYESIFAERFLTLFLVGLLSTSTLISCSPHARNRRPITGVKEAKTAGQIISDMETDIRLTDEQEVNLRPVIEEQVKKRNELIKKYQDRDCHGTDCLKDELKDLRISTENQLQYFLIISKLVEGQRVGIRKICSYLRGSERKPSCLQS